MLGEVLREGSERRSWQAGPSLALDEKEKETGRLPSL